MSSIGKATKGAPLPPSTKRSRQSGHDVPHEVGTKDHPSFGEKLRLFREQNGISLKQLAERAEISIGILSQIERGMNSPSLRTLTKVRTALGLPISFFFDDDFPQPEAEGQESFVCRASERPQLQLAKGSVRKELLHHNASRVFEFMMIELPPGSGTAKASYPSEKGGYVLEGEVTVTIGDKSATLYEGDSLLFDGVIPHIMENLAKKPAKLLWIIAKLPNNLFV